MGGALLERGGAGTFVGHTNGIVVAPMQAARVARLLDILEPLLVEHLDPVLDAPARRSFRRLAYRSCLLQLCFEVGDFDVELPRRNAFARRRFEAIAQCAIQLTEWGAGS
jgi:hypothetical protein